MTNYRFNASNITMPKLAHKDDVEWISDRIKGLPPQTRVRAAYVYDRAFKEAYDIELIEWKKDVAGRRNANKHLRIFCDTFSRSAIGWCDSPPEVKL